MESIARELIKVARELVSSEGLNGMSNRDAKKFVNTLLGRHTSGFFRDNGWTPIHKTFKDLDRHGIDYSITSSDYGVSRNFQDTWSGEKWKIPNDFKQWKFEIEFQNNKGRETTLYGVMTAHGAGSVEDPLDRYDVTAYVS